MISNSSGVYSNLSVCSGKTLAKTMNRPRNRITAPATLKAATNQGRLLAGS